MSIISRIVRLWKADLHGVMDQMEDKALLLKQCLREMETSLKQKQVRMAGLARTCERLRDEMALRSREQEKLNEDIALALRKKKDDIARLLIRKQMERRSDGEHMADQLRELEEEKGRLNDMLARQQGQYDRLRIQAAAYCRQAEQRTCVDERAPWTASETIRFPTEAEIEMELLRRKESLGQGGAA